ncbi:ribosome biogenesis GTPase Der [candidate division KSB3 bacterium]|uniref:GTPase Der n=1 Tax=candidate division KSB3 bacterium TaxID=2044937 RepID=A0A9D5JZ12_9BACT|nr:ribosome biogenesis GTPase Der [candidate division KSB3 bacterium]MBD3326839.1 ribosome biogenesis GTPase Der [candidate division KSB3 bacterium]
MRRTTVALVGRPNVGKSTLFNRLTGKHTAITEDVPGVTRDRIYGTCQWVDKVFSVIDTGGFMPDADDPMMSSMQLQTRLAMEEADVIICVFDGQSELTVMDFELVKHLRQTEKPIYYIANKIDAPQHAQHIHHLYRLGIDEVLPISAEHKIGLDELLDTICEHVAPSDEEEADTAHMRIAVVGRPNVGKSSLVNYLLGEDRMLVTDIAGTTRDAIDTDVFLHGSHYVFIDTSGIRRKSRIKDPLERYSVIRAFKSIDRCHIAFVMLDAVEGVTDQDARIAGYAHNNGRAILLVVNKWDLIPKDSSTAGQYVHRIKAKLKYLDYAPLIFISALTGLRVFKTLSLADQLYEQYNRRVPTSELNTALKQILKIHHPPVYKGKPVKVYYGTQAAVRPPTFVLFCNYPEGIHFSYKRYLVNALRDYFQLQGTPLHLRLQPR